MAAKACAKVIRWRFVSTLQAIAGQMQRGALPGGGMEFSAHIVRAFMASKTKEGRSSAAVFTDLKAAFYTAIPGVVLGKLMEGGARDVALEAVSMTVVERKDFIETFVDGETILESAGEDARRGGCRARRGCAHHDDGIGQAAPPARRHLVGG